jgi:hypothetical protein
MSVGTDSIDVENRNFDIVRRNAVGSIPTLLYFRLDNKHYLQYIKGIYSIVLFSSLPGNVISLSLRVCPASFLNNR